MKSNKHFAPNAMRTLELLAPARDLECGLAAISHGADAVYIGADRFGARVAAGNTVEAIRQLCHAAHQYDAKVYVTVNTIIYEEELPATKQLLLELAEAGVDALLIQDMGIMALYSELSREHPDMRLPALHASTQCDNRDAGKVKWLRQTGFSRVVLARELSAEEVAEVHEQVPGVELEVFVHGALCVSYSGVCYASQFCFHRSANRGECAQFCRLKFDLVDADGKEIEHQRHLLSLKDLCLIEDLEVLADAGASSFKIEGRLKDVDYVKNVVSAYSQRLDQLIARRPDEYCRASRGRVTYGFTPDLKKTFNRGFTSYFLQGRQPDIASFDTPKAIGEYVGKVKEISGHSFNVAGTACFSNGDGLCFINDERELEGFRVNRAEGNRLFPLRMPAHLHSGTALYRNNDEAFAKILAGKTAERKIPVKMTLTGSASGFILTADGAEARVSFEHQPALKPQHDNIVRQLTKLGNTPYECHEVVIAGGADQYFIPSSILTQLRHDLITQLARGKDSSAVGPVGAKAPEWYQPRKEYNAYPYLYNISNHLACSFYEERGLKDVRPAFECAPRAYVQAPLIMQCRYCIRYALGYCVRRGGRKPLWHEPLSLRLPDGRKFRLQFDCEACQMNIFAET